MGWLLNCKIHQHISDEERVGPLRDSKDKTAAEFVPGKAALPVLREALEDCRDCDLYLKATQAVPGDGPASSLIVFIGEQPGDEEDRQGQPFVGPAGRLLDRALQEAGIDRSQLYVTNAVQHFKFEERGKRRLHKKPSARETLACRPSLEAELEAIRPEVVVCLGATAARWCLEQIIELPESAEFWLRTSGRELRRQPFTLRVFYALPTVSGRWSTGVSSRI